MNDVAVLQDLYSRIGPTVRRGVEGLSDDALTTRLDPGANSIAWLAWHLARGQDLQVAAAVGRGQVWTAAGWDDRFGLPFAADDSGYGHTPDDVAQVRVPAALLLGYVDDVQNESLDVLTDLSDADLDTVVDRAWDPPVTLGARLVSVAVDSLEHAAQIAYVRGVLERGDRT
ncbi:DinB family protein [Isoptericola sp. S6320L]|uniref:mycothiol transferase n=1 Tax=Isoptericola sp. S6320L TaxID=2926411 RepID=UPI001FF6E9FC|nr:DinB family protein [Isoptericola sp. S6320L]MCK0117458.1 DinB family protein [Isoptericola sp. S6320L]